MKIGRNLKADRNIAGLRGRLTPVGSSLLTVVVAVPLGVISVVALGNLGFDSANHAGHTPSARSNDLRVETASRSRARVASTILRAANGSRVGTVRFETKGSRTVVEAKIKLPAGTGAVNAFHGFHIHANNKPENGNGCLADPAQPQATWFVSADGHFSELGQKHEQHTGDMPSPLVNDDGTAVIEFTSTRLDVNDLADRAVVLHAGPDNFGNVPTGVGPDQYTANSTAATDKTAATGNSGDRLACGVVKVKR